MMDAEHFRSSYRVTRRFSLISALIVLASVGIIGEWTSWRSGRSVMADIGLRNNLYFQVLLGPHAPDISEGGELSPEAVEIVHRIVEQASSNLDVMATKIWSPEGRILFASDPSLQGQEFPIDADLARALTGSVVVETGSLRHREAYYDDQEFIESYVPIRETPDGPVVVVAELYQDSSAFMSAMIWTRLKTWLIAGIGAVGVMAVVRWIKAHCAQPVGESRGNSQRGEPERIGEVSLDEHSRFRQKFLCESGADEAERQLRRIGTDLHDGVGQLLAATLLKLEALFPQGEHDENYRSIRGMLDEAVTEVRAMAAGLVLPHVRDQGLADAVSTVVSQHRKRTSTEVALVVEEGLAEPELTVKVAICRFVQEGLANAFKHAGGAEQSVVLCRNGAGITVIVQDRGPGIPPALSRGARQPLGLLGLRDRVEGLGGTFEISSEPGEGTTIYGHFHRLFSGGTHGRDTSCGYRR